MSTQSQEKSWSTTKNALAFLDKPLIRFIGKGMLVGLVTGMRIRWSTSRNNWMPSAPFKLVIEYSMTKKSRHIK